MEKIVKLNREELYNLHQRFQGFTPILKGARYDKVSVNMDTGEIAFFPNLLEYLSWKRYQEGDFRVGRFSKIVRVTNPDTYIYKIKDILHFEGPQLHKGRTDNKITFYLKDRDPVTITGNQNDFYQLRHSLAEVEKAL